MALSTQLSNIAKMLSQNGGGVGIPDDPEEQTKLQQSGVTDPLISMMGQAGMNLFGGSNASVAGQKRQEVQNLKDSLKTVDLTSSTGMLDAAKQYQEGGYPEQAISLIKQAQEAKILENQRTKLAQQRLAYQEQATKLGFPEVAASIESASPEDLRDTGKFLREKQALEIVIKNGVPARKAWAKGNGIVWEEGFAKITDAQFMDTMTGLSADLKPYSINGENVTLPTRSGQVKYEERWRPANSVEGLAPVISRSVQTVAKASGEALGQLYDSQIDNVNDSYNATKVAVGELATNKRTLDLVNRGIPTGKFAGVEQWIMSVVADLPGVPESFADDVSTGEQFIKLRGKELLAIIPILGPPVSDVDIRTAERIIGATYTDTEATMRAYLELENISKRATIASHNELVGRLRQQQPNSESWQTGVDFYSIDNDISAYEDIDFSRPEPPATVNSQRQSILDEVFNLGNSMSGGMGVGP